MGELHNTYGGPARCGVCGNPPPFELWSSNGEEQVVVAICRVCVQVVRNHLDEHRRLTKEWAESGIGLPASDTAST